MMAALTAAGQGARVILLERQSRVGRKLAVTGNGRCNLTNLGAAPEHYHGGDPDFVRPALERFGVDQTLDFFLSLGLVTVTEPDGRVYPYSDQAGSVVDVLRFALDAYGVDTRLGFEVRSVIKSARGFLLRSDGESFECDRLIVAGGGAAGTKCGGGSGGYDALRALGHGCTKLYPALVQLKTDNTYTRPLKGVRADADVTVSVGSRVIAHSSGEVQFTDYGVSGPAVFDISRAAAQHPGSTVTLDLMRLTDTDGLCGMLRRRAESFPDLTLENLLTGMVHNKLGRTAIQRCGLSLGTPLGSLGEHGIRAVAGTLKAYTLPVHGTTGMDGAQVTCGGVPTSEFCAETMESRLVPGLFACGEVLDIDGDCGGYNLQWAWSSGAAAGTACAAGLC